jgi:hypothetical protein
VPNYLAIYEHQSTEVQNTEAYEKVRSTPWTEWIIPHCKVCVRNFYAQIFPEKDHVPDWRLEGVYTHKFLVYRDCRKWRVKYLRRPLIVFRVMLSGTRVLPSGYRNV